LTIVVPVVVLLWLTDIGPNIIDPIDEKNLHQPEFAMAVPTNWPRLLQASRGSSGISALRLTWTIAPRIAGLPPMCRRLCSGLVCSRWRTAIRWTESLPSRGWRKGGLLNVYEDRILRKLLY